MKELLCTEPGTFTYRQASLPQPAEGQAIVRIKRIGICGTDLHAFEGTQPYFSYPRILGHELAGEVVHASTIPIGTAVTLMPYFNCEQCIACQRGYSNCCTSLKVFGVHIDGGMREYITVPENKLLHAPNLSFDELALVEPLAIGAHAIRRAVVKPGEFVVVAGAGPIGVGIMEAARISGAQVIAVDVGDKRLQFCADQLKVEHTINAATTNAVAAVQSITDGDMATVVIDATGSLAAINKGLDYLAHSGRYILVGLQKEAFHFSHPEFHKREATLMSSRNATPEDFAYVMSCIASGKMTPLKYITHHLHFDELSNAFAPLLKPDSLLVKAMVTV